MAAFIKYHTQTFTNYTETKKELKIHQTQHHFRVIVHMVRFTTSIKNKTKIKTTWQTNAVIEQYIISFRNRVVVVEECLQPFSVFGFSPLYCVWSSQALTNTKTHYTLYTNTHTKHIYYYIREISSNLRYTFVTITNIHTQHKHGGWITINN